MQERFIIAHSFRAFLEEFREFVDIHSFRHLSRVKHRFIGVQLDSILKHIVLELLSQTANLCVLVNLGLIFLLISLSYSYKLALNEVIASLFSIGFPLN